MSELFSEVLRQWETSAADPEVALLDEGRRHVSATLGAPEPAKEQPATTQGVAAYYHDPVGFARDCIRWRPGERLTFYQDGILERLPKRPRQAVRGPHGLGKTAVAAIVTLWFSLTRDAAGVDWKAPTTASVWRQLTKFLWPEIHKWARRLDWEKIGRPPFDRPELQTLALKLTHGEAFAVASDTPEQIEGAHADSILYVFDESKIIPDDTFDAAEGAFSGAGEDTGREAFALAISTPGEPLGRFFDIHKHKPGFEDWDAKHVTLEDAIKAGRVSRQWAASRKRQWGEKSTVFMNRVLGEFASSDEDSVIPLAWVELANERWRARMERIEAGLEELPPLRRVALDVARGGKDKTVLARLHGDHVPELERFNFPDTMQTAGVLNGILEAHDEVDAWIDVIGIGAGVFDRVREVHGSRSKGFNAAEKTDAKDRSGELGFKNIRSAAWWALREQLDPAFEPTLELPPDDELTGDLTAPKWKIVSDGKIEVESKDQLRKPERLGRSTDAGDAVVQLVADKPLGWRFVPMGQKDDDDRWNSDKARKERPSRFQVEEAMPHIFAQYAQPNPLTCGECAYWKRRGDSSKGYCELQNMLAEEKLNACDFYFSPTAGS